MATTPALISGREACETLGIGRSTLTYWMLTGRLTPAQTVGSEGRRAALHLFDRREVERLAEQRRAS